MPLIPHTFDEENHQYLVPGRFVLGLSSIIQLNGLANHDQIPLDVMLRAATRGNEFDKLVEDFENELLQQPSGEQARACFAGYTTFKSDHEVKLAGPMQCRMVWGHRDTGILIGCTPDLVMYVDGELYNVDTKCTYPLFGRAKEQKYLAWRIQLQGQVEAWNENDDWMVELGSQGKWKYPKKAILHCHPKLKNGYNFITFPQDDALLFSSAIVMATEKLAAGFQIERK